MTASPAFVAHVDPAGVIRFCRCADAPVGAFVFARCADLDALKAAVEVKARLAYDNEMLLVPGVPEAETVSVALSAIERWRDWAFQGFPQTAGAAVLS